VSVFGSDSIVFRHLSYCEQSLTADWPIVDKGIMYDVRMGHDPIDGYAPVLIRTEVSPDGTLKRNPDGSVNRSIKTLTIDDLTGFLNGSDKLVKHVINLLIEAAARNGKTMAYIFVDINDLNKVNNFGNKQVDGDNYIKLVSQAVRTVFKWEDNAHNETLDPHHLAESRVSADSEWGILFDTRKKESALSPAARDWVIRDGGDELVILVYDAPAEALIKIMNRIQKLLLQNGEVQEIFDRQRQHTYRELNAELAKQEPSVAQIVEDVLSSSLPNFEAVKDRLYRVGVRDEELLKYVEAVDTAKRLYPSVSIGSAMVGPNSTYASLKTVTSKQAYLVKSNYKKGMGLDLKKYGVFGAEVAPVSSLRNHLPEILPPVLDGLQP
jgi:GGDEF domain-containing protein